MPKFNQLSPYTKLSPTRSSPKRGKLARTRRVDKSTMAMARFRSTNKKLLAIFRAKPSGDYDGRDGNCLEVVLHRLNSGGTRWAIQFFCGAAQIGGNLIKSGKELTEMPAELAGHANGAHFEMTAFNNTNEQPSAATGAGNGVLFTGGR